MIAPPTQDVQIEPGAVEVRRSTPADRQALVEMYLGFEPKGAAFGLPPRKEPETWLDHLTPYPNFVAWVDGRVVGHSVLCPEDDLGEVAVFVHQDHRRRGLGKKLLRELVQEARRLGLRRIWGMTETDNLPMLRLAFSLGFVIRAGPHEFYLDLDQQIPADHEEIAEISAT